MESSNEALQKPTTWGQAEQSVKTTLEKIQLSKYIPSGNQKRSIAILGAGSAVEVHPLTDYFIAHGFGKPAIIAFDLDDFLKSLTEKQINLGHVNLDYRLKDFTDPKSFKDELYDMVIIRKPVVHKFSGVWAKAFRNGFDHLKPNGIFLATTDIYDNFVRGQLVRGGEIVKFYTIPEEDSTLPYFNDSALFIARKKGS